jgi:hypothetical protein
MEAERALPCSQQPATGPYPEPDESSPHLPTCLCKIHSNINFPSTTRSSEWSPLILSRPCYMPHQSHPPWPDHLNNTWWSVQVMKLLVMQSSPVSCHFFPYSTQHPVLWDPQCERQTKSHPYKANQCLYSRQVVHDTPQTSAVRMPTDVVSVTPSRCMQRPCELLRRKHHQRHSSPGYPNQWSWGVYSS